MMSPKVTLGKPHVKHFMKQVPASTSACASSFTYLVLPWPHPGSRFSFSPRWCAATWC